MGSPRIGYVDPKTITDPDMRAEFERARREGTPREESHAIRAHVPAVFWSFTNTWQTVFREGLVDHAIKELCRVYVSRAVKCNYCGGQRSTDASRHGLLEADYADLLRFRDSDRYTERQKAALALAEAITWDQEVGDGFWARLHESFTEPELVELGYFIGFTMGQQRFLRTLDLDRHPLPDPPHQRD